ncbi:MAG: tetratricopeptide repeat protein [Candidatus Zixiibacteriota bacterium]
MTVNLISELASKGYWPALAMEYFLERKYARAIELCMIRLKEYPDILSGRIVYARSLYHTGQYESAEEQFYKILGYDPNNLVALKYLGDLKFRAGDEATAFAYYLKILEIEPNTNALTSPINHEKEETEQLTRVLVLRKKSDERDDDKDIPLRELPFKTETLGDLLLKQGHPRLALKIFQELAEKNGSPQLREKIEKTQQSIKK